MKRTILIVIAALSAISFASAQSLPNLQARDARTMGLGGCFAATSSGFQSFYGNPAGFATPKGQLTIADVSVWGYLKPTTDNINRVMNDLNGGDSTTTAEWADLANDFIVENGFGGGASVGLGYAGHGLGLGLFAIADASAAGDSLMGSVISSTVSVNAVAGMGIPVKLGPLTLKVGADIRPFLRIDAADGGWLATELVTAFMSGGDVSTTLMSENVDAGFGVAADLGAQLVLGSLSVGLAIRDVTASYLTQTETIQEFVDAISAGNLPTGTDESAIYPAIYAGLAWQPKLIPGIIEPSLYFEVQDPVSIIEDNASVWNLLHAGAEVELLSLVSLRAGLNKGYLSAGVGLNLLVVEVNAAVFTEELGDCPGDQGRSGVAIQAAIHL